MNNQISPIAKQEWNVDMHIFEGFVKNTTAYHLDIVTRLGDLLDFGHVFKAFGNN